MTFELAPHARTAIIVGATNLENRFRDVETNECDGIRHGSAPIRYLVILRRSSGKGERGHLCHHFRRRFYELAVAGPAPIAGEALQRTATLYEIEQNILGRAADERRAVRQERARPLIESFDAWLCDELLDDQIFHSLRGVRIVIESWRHHYNTVRPHESLGYKPPAPEVSVPALAAWAARNPDQRRRLSSPKGHQ